LPGVELTAKLRGKTLHFVCYGAEKSREVEIIINHNLDERRRRFASYLRSLIARGYKIPSEAVKEKIRQHESLGKPLVADLLVEMGYFKHRIDVFESDVFSKSNVAFDAVSVDYALPAFKEAGFFISLAHPLIKGVSSEDITYLKELGLDGIEVYCPTQNERARLALLQICTKLDLYPCGGSDFHGEGKMVDLGEYYMPKGAYKAILGRFDHEV
jgi:predicted metal-dependent phosphoesterase TrpH